MPSSRRLRRRKPVRSFMSSSSRSSMPGASSREEGDVSITREVKYTRRTTRGQEIAMALLGGKVAIITGASKGIGRAVSLRFAQEKAAVVCAARSGDLVRDTAELVGKAGGRAIAVTCDAAKEDDVRRMIAAGPPAVRQNTTLVKKTRDGGAAEAVDGHPKDHRGVTNPLCPPRPPVCTA